MAFQIKDFTSISASVLNILRATQNKITDFNIGSIVRSMIEAVAAEIDELYQQMFIGLKEAIPVAIYNSFQFQPLMALPASGLVRVTITASASPTIIPASTAFTLANGAANYLSNVDVTIADGNTYADILVTSDVAGAFANISSGQTFALAPAVTGLVSATNLSAFLSGTDEESIDDRKVRFNAFVSSLNRGTVAALSYGLNLSNLTDAQGNIIERVVSSSIIEPWLTDDTQPISLVKCYIHNGVGATSSGLVARARDVIYGYYDALGVAVPGWKAAGVKVEVYAATEVAVNVTGVLVAQSGYDKPTLLALAGPVVYSYILALGIGKPAIKSEMIALIMNIDGVANITLSVPSGDTAATAVTKLMPGTIALT